MYAGILVPSEVRADALAVVTSLLHALQPAAPEPGRLARFRQTSADPAPPASVRQLDESAVFVLLAKFGNLTGADATGLAGALSGESRTWPSPVLHVEGVGVDPAAPYKVEAALGGEVDGVAGIFRGVHQSAAKVGFFLDRRGFEPQFQLGTLDLSPGTSSAWLTDAVAHHRGPDWQPDHVSLLKANAPGAEAAYEELARLRLG